MAKVVITNDVVEFNKPTTVNLTAGTTDGFLFDFSPADNKMVLLFQNTAEAAGTVTVKKGNGLQGVKDLDTLSIPAAGFVVYELESGAFKNVSGTDKGKVLVVPSAITIKASAIQLA